MESILFMLAIGLASGIAIGLQGPMASIITQRLGALESVFIVHFGGAIIALIPILIYGSKLGQWRSVPWYTLGTGLFGVMVIASISYMIPRLGVATATTIVIAGQLLAGVVLDHYGLLGVTTKSLDAARVVGLAIVTVGVWLTVR